jgi:hypothetical protein
MKKPKKKDEVEMTDGKKRKTKTREEQEKELQELEEILQTGKYNPYGTTNAETFQKKLSEMTLDELRLLSSRVGITPISRESVLREQLMESFNDFIRRSRQNISGPNTAPDINHPAIKDIRHLIDTI